MPGVEVFALATVPPGREWGETWLASGRMSLRFRKPVYDGERVTVAVDGDDVRVVGPDGVVRATGSVAPPGQPSAVGVYEDVDHEAIWRLGSGAATRG